MRNIVVCISVLALIFASCASSQGGGVSGGSGPNSAMVETKASVLFADGSLDEYTTSEYDPSFSRIMKQQRFSASGSLLEEVEYSYGEKNRLTGKVTKDAESKQKNKVEYHYDAQGNLQREVVVNDTGKPVSSYEYTYDGKGHRTGRVINSGAGMRLVETVFTLNSNGTIATAENRDAGGQLISSTQYTYDDKGKLISQKTLDAAGKTTSTNTITWENGRQVKSEQTGSDGVVQIRVSCEYGDSGEMLKKTVENILGKSIQIQQFDYTAKPGKGAK